MPQSSVLLANQESQLLLGGLSLGLLGGGLKSELLLQGSPLNFSFFRNSLDFELSRNASILSLGSRGADLLELGHEPDSFFGSSLSDGFLLSHKGVSFFRRRGLGDGELRSAFSGLLLGDEDSSFRSNASLFLLGGFLLSGHSSGNGLGSLLLGSESGALKSGNFSCLAGGFLLSLKSLHLVLLGFEKGSLFLSGNSCSFGGGSVSGNLLLQGGSLSRGLLGDSLDLELGSDAGLLS